MANGVGDGDCGYSGHGGQAEREEQAACAGGIGDERHEAAAGAAT